MTISKEKIVILILIFGPLLLNAFTDCTKLRVGQFLCPDPNSTYDFIDHKTQSVVGCKKDGTATGK